MTIEIMLDNLAELQSQIDASRLQCKELKDDVLTAEQKQQMADIDAEFDAVINHAQDMSALLEADIKADVLKAGASVKGAHLQAVWSKPRVSWDTKALDGYSAAHPELLTFRKEGDPSISIRKV